MNKAELTEAIIKKTKGTKTDTEDFINALIDAVKADLKKDGGLQLVGFGTFKVVKRAARVGRNPNNGREIKIPAKKVVKFTAGKTLKESVNK